MWRYTTFALVFLFFSLHCEPIIIIVCGALYALTWRTCDYKSKPKRKKNNKKINNRIISCNVERHTAIKSVVPAHTDGRCGVITVHSRMAKSTAQSIWILNFGWESSKPEAIKICVASSLEMILHAMATARSSRHRENKQLKSHLSSFTIFRMNRVCPATVHSDFSTVFFFGCLTKATSFQLINAYHSNVCHACVPLM